MVDVTECRMFSLLNSLNIAEVTGRLAPTDRRCAHILDGEDIIQAIGESDSHFLNRICVVALKTKSKWVIFGLKGISHE
jgi:hypothetical protein